MVEVDISPVAFDQIETDEWLAGRRPFQYQWYAHQLIREALDYHRTLCLFLVTPTGSGKTLAAYAYSVKTGLAVLGTYPTNELLADQENALRQGNMKVQAATGLSAWTVPRLTNGKSVLT